MSDEKNTINKQEQVLTEQASSEITDLDLDQAVGGVGRFERPVVNVPTIRIDSEKRIAYVPNFPQGLHPAFLEMRDERISELVKNGYSIERVYD